MIVRLGYVAISNKLGKKITSSSTVTYKTYSNIINDEKKFEKLKSVTLSNLNDLITILKYNIDNNFHFYRLTSKLVPLATHKEVNNFDYLKIFKKDFEYIGNLIKKNNMRVDSHPDQFNVINTVNEEVFKNTIINLDHHVDIFDAINYKEGKMVIHVGGANGGKEEALERFVTNFNKLEKRISEKLIIENDDKIFTTKDVLELCKKIKSPMVLDVHHHNCNNYDDLVEDYLDEVFKTWDNEIFPPKIHFSSPREFINDRKHADYIDANDFNDFLLKAKKIDRDFDCMLECKEKDLALIKLVSELKEINKNISFIDESTLKL